MKRKTPISKKNKKNVIVDAYYDASNHEEVLGNHNHTENEMILVKEGQAIFNLPDKKYKVGKNNLLLISALENHSTEIISAPYHRYVLVTSMELTSSYIKDPLLESAFFSFQQYGPISLRDDLALELEERFKLLIDETSLKEEKWEERSSLILYDILILIYREHYDIFNNIQESENLDIIFSVKEYIDKNYYDDISLDFIEEKFFINKYYLSRQFKEVIGYGFNKYLQLIRIHNAKILLKTTKYSISEVCEKVGYKNTNYFIRLFKDKEGITPYQYHKLYKEEP